MIDFSRVDKVTVKLADLQDDYNRQDLINATHEMIDEMLRLIEDAQDDYVTFLPDDPLAYDPGAATEAEKTMPWTLAHVIVHTTATAEECAANGATLARGIAINGRNRYETPWETVTTAEQLRQRLEESRRIRVAYLNAWPDEPHLEILFSKFSATGELNAIGYTLYGLFHDNQHVGQIADIMQQAREAFAQPSEA